MGNPLENLFGPINVGPEGISTNDTGKRIAARIEPKPVLAPLSGEATRRFAADLLRSGKVQMSCQKEVASCVSKINNWAISNNVPIAKVQKGRVSNDLITILNDFTTRPFIGIKKLEDTSADQWMEYIVRLNSLMTNLKIDHKNQHGMQMVLRIIYNSINNNYDVWNTQKSQSDAFERDTGYTKNRDFLELAFDESKVLIPGVVLPEPFKQCQLHNYGIQFDPETINIMAKVLKYIPEVEIRRIIERTPIYIIDSSLDINPNTILGAYASGKNVYIPKSMLEKLSFDEDFKSQQRILMAHEMTHVIFDEVLDITRKSNNVFSDYQSQHSKRLDSVSEASEVSAWANTVLLSPRNALNNLITSNTPVYLAARELFNLAIKEWCVRNQNYPEDKLRRDIQSQAGDTWDIAFEIEMNKINSNGFNQFNDIAKQIFIEESNNIVEYRLRQIGKLS